MVCSVSYASLLLLKKKKIWFISMLLSQIFLHSPPHHCIQKSVLLCWNICIRASLLAQTIKNKWAMQCRRPRFDPWVGKIPILPFCYWVQKSVLLHWNISISTCKVPVGISCVLCDNLEGWGWGGFSMLVVWPKKCGVLKKILGSIKRCLRYKSKCKVRTLSRSWFV